jgi:hypothetical protein
MAENINELIKKYVPEKDTPVAGEDVFFDEKNNVVRVQNAYGTSLYDPSGKLLYGKGALYDTNIGSITGRNVQIFGRNDEIGLAASGIEGLGDAARIERQRKEAAYAQGGTQGLVNYLNESYGFTPSGTLTGNNKNTGTATPTDAETRARRTAQQDFRAALAELGLADLADTVDSFIRNDYTVSQIKLELPKQQAYKDRFPGMEALRAAGQAVNEATYISMEKGYMQTLQAYGLDTKTLGGRKQLGTYISNLVSPREFEERVNLAATRVKDNADVISQFKVYYPEVDNSALTAYLLNPTVGMDIIKKQVRLAEIGAAAMDVGFATGVSLSTAEELRGAVGEQDYQTVRSAFAQAKVLSDQQARLARIEGTNYSQNEAIQGIVGRDIQSQMASQKRAERETMTRFGGRSGVTSTSLRSDTEI